VSFPLNLVFENHKGCRSGGYRKEIKSAIFSSLRKSAKEEELSGSELEKSDGTISTDELQPADF
jgi:hypothetical protein